MDIDIDQVLLKLKTSLTNEIYSKYIQNLKFKKNTSNENNLYFIAPNKIIANWIQTKYSDKISNAYETLYNQKVTVHIQTKDTKTSKNNSKLLIKKDNNNSILNPTYTFESFVVGSSNEFAYNAALAVAKHIGTAYNPMFIYGPTGLGKTHLIHSIGNYAQERNKNVMYITSEQFMNDFFYNIQNKSMNNFRSKYRNCDILLIDDIQFFSNKEKIQEEFFHTFNELYSNNKQIILTSDKPPKMIKGLEERLKSRFEWGLIADISIPELETKIAIIKKKCEIDKINLNNEVINYIAANMGDNIREIESAIINLNAYANLMKQNITLEFAKNVIKDQIKEKRDHISIEDIIKTVSRTLNLKPNEIKSKSRNKNIVQARRIVIYLSRELTPNSMPTIASFFSMKDHTSISKNMKKISSLLIEDELFKLTVEEIKNKILSD
ncbi:MAG: Chromosomal replication initiator protein DnaA [uncultured Campylobacterales bacterium]|uniref:Chromosomal replication initiator protein DnaA n=1 Tax=uncultured Campylobacterales bacterium TaxID=352960 RepID=A0A6S6SDJ7_9BACT|nr:MAG: Chromosomal replication initiator protein DnaA [uncultured Campylobacterales bacterium]